VNVTPLLDRFDVLKGLILAGFIVAVYLVDLVKALRRR
jgi:hypothetical protein